MGERDLEDNLALAGVVHQQNRDGGFALADLLVAPDVEEEMAFLDLWDSGFLGEDGGDEDEGGDGGEDFEGHLRYRVKSKGLTRL